MVMTPGLLPGENEPPPMTLPVMVPVPCNVPSASTVTSLVIEPFTANTPALTSVVPRYVLVWSRMNVPTPCLVRPPAPVMDAVCVIVSSLFTIRLSDTFVAPRTKPVLSSRRLTSFPETIETAPVKSLPELSNTMLLAGSAVRVVVPKIVTAPAEPVIAPETVITRFPAVEVRLPPFNNEKSPCASVALIPFVPETELARLMSCFAFKVTSAAVTAAPVLTLTKTLSPVSESSSSDPLTVRLPFTTILPALEVTLRPPAPIVNAGNAVMYSEVVVRALIVGRPDVRVMSSVPNSPLTVTEAWNCASIPAFEPMVMLSSPPPPLRTKLLVGLMKSTTIDDAVLCTRLVLSFATESSPNVIASSVLANWNERFVETNRSYEPTVGLWPE